MNEERKEEKTRKGHRSLRSKCALSTEHVFNLAPNYQRPLKTYITAKSLSTAFTMDVLGRVLKDITYCGWVFYEVYVN